MKIRTRSRLILVGTIIIFLIVLSFITQSVILESFQAIEVHEANANMQRVLFGLHDQVEQVAALCRDRAESNDTYQFVNDLNQEYIQTNLAQPTSFKNLGIDYMLFYNSSGTLVYAKGFSSEDGTELHVSDDLTGIVRNSIIPEGVPEGVSGRRGFSILNGEPIILVGYAITTSDLSGSPRGTLVMVRNFTSERVDQVAQETQLAISFQPLSRSTASLMLNDTDWTRVVKGAIIIKPANDSVMTGTTAITGIENKPSLILVTVDTSRPVYQQVQQSIAILAVAIIILTAIFLLVVQLLLQRFILAPLSALDRDIKEIGKTGNLSRRSPEKGDEEIASMAHSLNNMLDVIEKQRNDLNSARNELETRNGELEEMVEEVQQQRDELDKARQDLADRNRDLEELLVEIQQQRDALHDARQTLAERNKDLEELNRKANLYLDIYLDVLTYEILNAIMGLRGYAGILKETSGEKEKLLAEKIEALAKKSDDVIRNIQTISRIYKAPPQVHPVSLCDVLDKVRVAWKGMTIHIGDCDQMVLADEMLSAVFDNIFSNSLKYGGNTVTIGVEMRKTSEEMIEVAVTDNGPGISDEMKPQIFDRFAKDSAVRSSYGLGLHIVKMIVESYGGKVWASDRVKGDFTKGVAIWFTLRAAQQ